MRISAQSTWTVLALGLGCLLGGSVPIHLSHAAHGEEVEPQSLLKPDWQVGQQWIVKTRQSPIQTARQADAIHAKWRFHVTSVGKVGDRPCYRVDVRCLSDERPAATTSFWCDTETLSIRKVELNVRVASRMCKLVETYEAVNREPTAIATPIQGLLVDLPGFLPGGSKGLQTFTYISRPLPTAAKDPAVLCFRHSLEQTVSRLDSEELNSLPPGAKSLASNDLIDVRLKDSHRTVRQLWKPGQPWPAYSTDGRTESWLVDSLPGAKD